MRAGVPVDCQPATLLDAVRSYVGGTGPTYLAAVAILLLLPQNGPYVYAIPDAACPCYYRLVAGRTTFSCPHGPIPAPLRRICTQLYPPPRTLLPPAPDAAWSRRFWTGQTVDLQDMHSRYEPLPGPPRLRTDPPGSDSRAVLPIIDSMMVPHQLIPLIDPIPDGNGLHLPVHTDDSGTVDTVVPIASTPAADCVPIDYPAHPPTFLPVLPASTLPRLPRIGELVNY